MTQTRAQIHQDHEGALGLPFAIAVGTLIAERPPPKSRRAQFTHRASTSGG